MSQETDSNWVEYADYVNKTSELTENQSYAIAGKCLKVDDEKIAEVLGTTPSTVRTQRNRVNCSDLSQTKQREIWKPPVPSTAFKKIGSIDYFTSDHWDNGAGGSGDVEIYESFPNGDYVVVIEEFTRVLQDLDRHKDENGVRAVMDKVEKHVIYDSLEEFLRNSQHSPKNLPDIENDLNINENGDLF